MGTSAFELLIAPVLSERFDGVVATAAIVMLMNAIKVAARRGRVACPFPISGRGGAGQTP